MALLPQQYPLINGNTYDHSSVILKFDGQQFEGIKSITYKHTLEPGKIRGTRAQVLKTTRGVYDAEGSIEMLYAEYLLLAQALANKGAKRTGYMEQFFTFTATYDEPSIGTVTDTGSGVKFKSAELSSQEGGDATIIKCDLFMMGLYLNGLDPMGTQQYLRA